MSSASPHILGDFQQALDDLNRHLDEMAKAVEGGLELALSGLFDRDTSLADQVSKKDSEIDQLEIQIDSEGLRIITLYQPVASDLRKVVSVMKVSGNLERIGDEAVNIAKRARRLNKKEELSATGLAKPAGDLAIRLLQESVRAFHQGEVGDALDVKKEDKDLNQICDDAGKNLTKRVEAGSERIKDYVNLMFIFRSIERIGDHAKNIAEDAVFAESAYDIRHGGEKPEVDEEE